MPSDAHVIILVHGIRDYALWQERIRRVLAEEFIVESTNYGRFDLFRFLVPGNYFRNWAIESVWNQIRDVKKEYPNAKFSFIAHSFGTYIVAHILKRDFDFTAFRIVFCGSVVKRNYPFEQISERFASPIVNDVGTKDIWPAIAESLTWGYGSAGTFGFHRPRVHDRWHTGARHGYFLSPGFCREFWVPFFKDGTIVDGTADPEEPSIWLQTISVIRLKYILIIAFLGIFAAVMFVPNVRDFVTAFFRRQVCYPYSPVDDKPDKTQPKRKCLPGRLSYVKWIDEEAYKDKWGTNITEMRTGRWVNDRANRSLTITRVGEDGTPIWTEQNLLRSDNGSDYWQPLTPGGWTEIAGASTEIVSGQTGVLLRQIAPPCPSTDGTRTLLETYFPLDLDDLLDRQHWEVEMTFRKASFNCVYTMPLELGDIVSKFEGEAKGPFVRAIKDR